MLHEHANNTNTKIDIVTTLIPLVYFVTISYEDLFLGLTTSILKQASES